MPGFTICNPEQIWTIIYVEDMEAGRDTNELRPMWKEIKMAEINDVANNTALDAHRREPDERRNIKESNQTEP